MQCVKRLNDATMGLFEHLAGGVKAALVMLPTSRAQGSLFFTFT